MTKEQRRALWKRRYKLRRFFRLKKNDESYCLKQMQRLHHERRQLYMMYIINMMIAASRDGVNIRTWPQLEKQFDCLVDVYAESSFDDLAEVFRLGEEGTVERTNNIKKLLKKTRYCLDTLHGWFENTAFYPDTYNTKLEIDSDEIWECRTCGRYVFVPTVNEQGDMPMICPCSISKYPESKLTMYKAYRYKTNEWKNLHRLVKEQKLILDTTWKGAVYRKVLSGMEKTANFLEWMNKDMKKQRGEYNYNDD